MQPRLLSKGELKPLSDLITHLGFDSFFPGEFTLHGKDPVLQSPHRLGEAVSYVLGLDAIAAAAIWKYRTNQDNNITLNIHDAIHYLHPTHFIWQNGYKLELGAETVPTNGLYQCKDGKFVMIESGPPYRKLELGYLNFFNCGNNREAIKKAISQWNSFELQEKLSDLGLPCCIALTKEEWLSHPQGKILANTPVVEIEKIGEGKPTGLEKNPVSPLAGVNVLDFTHVLAGPRSTCSLAEFGANVLHVSSPYHRDTLVQDFAVNNGKTNAYLDLTTAKDVAKLQELLTATDIFATSYRPAVTEKFTLTPHDLVKHCKKGIVYLSINTYGHEGPWKYRPGFDQLGQVTSGFAVTEGGIQSPRFSPVFYLTDLLTGYFAVAGMMAALLKRATEGGSYHVKVSLSRSAMWAQDLGYLDANEFGQAPKTDTYPTELVTDASPYGEITRLAPATKFSNMPKVEMKPVAPFGCHWPEW